MSKKILAALLAVCMVAGLLFVPATAATAFDDVDSGHWAASAIERWAELGVVNGVGDGKYEPDRVMTRAEFASLLVKLMGFKATSDKTFTDMKEGAWYVDVISKAVAAGIINGYNDGSVRPNDPITFEQAAVMLARALGLSKTTGGADWSKEAIDNLTSLGMIGKDVDEHLVVGGTCDRAVVAKLADNIIAEYVSEDTTIEGKEIKGVVLAVNGAKVELKDCTVTAPITVESAEVTLTNTKAADVKLGGEKAAVTADEKSSVADVTVAGEAPKADIKGEVTGTVTLEQGTSDAVVDAPSDKIDNKSGNEATINGEKVVPDETTTTKPAVETIPEHVHSWKYTYDSAQGKHSAVCTVMIDGKACTATIDATACTWTGAVSQKDATNHIRTCNVCGGAKDEAHGYGSGSAAAGDPCTVCGYKKTAVIPDDAQSHVHSYAAASATSHEKYVAATCTVAGVDVFLCENSDPAACSAYQTAPVAAKGHSLPDGDVTQATGYRLIKAATCVDDGTYEVKCKNCDVIITGTIDATGSHTYGDAETEKWAPYNNGAQHVKTCLVCGYKDSSTAADHTPAAPYTSVNSTQHAYTCKCGQTVQVDHTWTVTEKTEDDSPKTDVAATCTTAGTNWASKCNDCNATKAKETIPALGHSWGEWTADGNTMKRTCSRDASHVEVCGDAEHDHTWGAWSGDTRACTNCGKTETCAHQTEWATAWVAATGKRTCTKADGCGMVETCPHNAWGAWANGKHACSTCGHEELCPYNHSTLLAGAACPMQCGYTKPSHTCTPTGEWQKDSDKHWKACGVAGCKLNVNEAPHSYDSTTGKCGVCGQVDPSHVHSYGKGDATQQAAGTLVCACGATKACDASPNHTAQAAEIDTGSTGTCGTCGMTINGTKAVP